MSDEKKHAMHNFSSSAIWMSCDLWYGFKRAAWRDGVPFDTAGEAAARGTRLHAELEKVLEGALAGARDPAELAGFDPEVLKCADMILAVLDRYQPLNVALEVEVPLPHEPDSDGHIDVLAWNETTLIEIDAKFGQIEVDPLSTQNRGYVYAALCRLAEKVGRENLPKEIILGIAQPALRGEVMLETQTLDEIIAFGREVQATVERQLAGKGLQGATDLATCSYCPAKKRCGHRTSLMGGLLAEIERLPVESLRTAALADEPDLVERIVRSRKEIGEVIDECVAIVVGDPERFPDWKRTRVSNARKFDLEIRSEDEIVAQLEQAGVDWPWVLASPAQLKKSYPEQELAVDLLTIDMGEHVRLTPLGGVAKRARKQKPPKPAFADAVTQAMRPLPEDAPPVAGWGAPPVVSSVEVPVEEADAGEKPARARKMRVAKEKSTKDKAIEEIKSQRGKRKK